MEVYLIHQYSSFREVGYILDAFDTIKVIEPIWHEIPSISLLNTVLNILKDISEPILILEDDVMFTKFYDFDKIESLVNKHKNQLDFLSLGSIYYDVKELERGVITGTYMQGTQAVIYYPSICEKIKKNDTDFKHIDVLINEKSIGASVFPFMTKQKTDSYSSITKLKDTEFFFDEKEYETLLDLYINKK